MSSVDPALLAQLQQIPLLQAMQLQVVQADMDGIHFSAPLAANRNDKGTAFAGSLASLLTLSGWAMTTLQARHAGFDLAVAVSHSELRYLLPVTDTLQIVCPPPTPEARHHFLHALQHKGRGRLPLESQALTADRRVAACHLGQFAAFPRPHA